MKERRSPGRTSRHEPERRKQQHEKQPELEQQVRDASDPLQKAKSRVKSVEYDESDVHTCPYVPWYQFLRCRIATCKNYNTLTPCRCLGIDRVKPEGTKIISDAEIHLYKFKGTGISTKVVQLKRKRATLRVKAILTLREFIQYIKDTYKGGAVWSTPSIRSLESSYPLKLSLLQWENWMWEYLLDETVWKEFLGRQDGECRDLNLHNLLAVSLSKYEKLLREFNNPEICNLAKRK